MLKGDYAVNLNKIVLLLHYHNGNYTVYLKYW